MYRKFKNVPIFPLQFVPNSDVSGLESTVEPRYNKVLGTMKITLLYQVSHIRVKKQRNIKNWDQQNYLVIRGFCYIRPLYNEVPLYTDYNKLSDITNNILVPTSQGFCYTVEPRYNEVLGTMKITLLYQVSHYIRVKKQRNIKSWDQQNYLVIRGFCYIRHLYNEVPLYQVFSVSRSHHRLSLS